MGFKKLEDRDFILSNSSVTSPMWSGNIPTLKNFHTSSAQTNSQSGKFYYSIYDKDPDVEDAAEVQFSIAYCDKEGKGSRLYNPLVPEASPSRTNYGQYKNLILGSEEDKDFIFGNITGSNFYALPIERCRYKEKILPGTMTLTLKGPVASINLTDDSKLTPTPTYTQAGRVYNLVSGSSGEVHTSVNSRGWSGGTNASSGSYGWFLPDIGMILINPEALKPNPSLGGISLTTPRNENTDDKNPQKLFKALEDAGLDDRGWTLNSEETINSNVLFVRIRNDEFNFSENPSYISGSTGEILFDSFIDNPKTYITTIGLYNDNDELLAVSKLSRPLRKDSTHEALIRVKLDF